MSRRLFAALAAECGLQVECQFDSWGPDGRYDLSAYGECYHSVQTVNAAADAVLRNETEELVLKAIPAIA